MPMNLEEFDIGTHPLNLALYLVALARVRPGVQDTQQQSESHKLCHPTYDFQR